MNTETPLDTSPDAMGLVNNPPPCYAINETVTAPEIVVTQQSPGAQKASIAEAKIDSVDLHLDGVAKVTRTFRVKLVRGVNKVRVRRLPTEASFGSGCLTVRPVLKTDVGEGAGSKGTNSNDMTVIHTEIVDTNPEESIFQEQAKYRHDVGAWTSPKLMSLDGRRSAIVAELKRIEGSRRSLRDHWKGNLTGTTRGLEQLTPSPTISPETTTQGPINEDHVLPGVSEYEEAMKQFDAQTAELRDELEEVKNETAKEREVVRKVVEKSYRFSKCVLGNILVEGNGGEATIVVKYRLFSARWSPTYELRVIPGRVNGVAKVRLDYSAMITQAWDAGEEWSNVSITLHAANSETVQPTVANLRPWYLYTLAHESKASTTTTPAIGGAECDYSAGSVLPSLTAPFVCTMAGCTLCNPSNAMPYFGAPPAHQAFVPNHPSSFENLLDAPVTSAYVFPPSPRSLRRQKFSAELYDNSLSAVADMFGGDGSIEIPNRITLFSRPGSTSRVPIMSVELEAEIVHHANPTTGCMNSNVPYLLGSMINTSSIFFLGGPASIRNGSRTVEAHMPSAAPGEGFTCPFGDDPSIKLTYHPRSSAEKRSGVLSKTVTHTMTQRITVESTNRLINFHKLVVREAVDATQDKHIRIKLLSPRLEDEKEVASSGGSIVEVGSGAVAPGIIEYVVKGLKAGKKSDLVMEWEIKHPAKKAVYSQRLCSCYTLSS